jgi:hypothetical protein
MKKIFNQELLKDFIIACGDRNKFTKLNFKLCQN